MVHDTVWLEILNELVVLRRTIRDNYGIPSRAEIKAFDIRRNRGVIRDLHWSRARRFDLYKMLLDTESPLPLKAFAIAVEKIPASTRTWEPREAAWTFALQRIHRFCVAENDRAILFPDEGDALVYPETSKANAKAPLRADALGKWIT